jgi:hypothetical protein
MALQSKRRAPRPRGRFFSHYARLSVRINSLVDKLFFFGLFVPCHSLLYTLIHTRFTHSAEARLPPTPYY